MKKIFKRKPYENMIVCTLVQVIYLEMSTKHTKIMQANAKLYPCYVNMFSVSPSSTPLKSKDCQVYTVYCVVFQG